MFGSCAANPVVVNQETQVKSPPPPPGSEILPNTKNTVDRKEDNDDEG